MHTYQIFIGGNHNNVGKTPIPNFEREVIELVLDMLESATVVFGTGIWKGEVEPTAIVTVADTHGREVRKFAKMAKSYFQQETVLVTSTRTTMDFI